MKKTKQKIICLLATIAMILTIIPVGSITARAIIENFTVDNLKYTIVADGVVSVGAVNDTLSGAVTIPGNVTYASQSYLVDSISEAGFAACINLTSVTLPATMSQLGVRAFNGCTALTTVSIPADSVLSTINNFAFSFCSALDHITIPDNATTMGTYAFYCCYAMTTLPFNATSKLTNIGEKAFSNCTGMTSINIPDTVTSIGAWAFEYNPVLTSVSLPDTIAPLTIGDGAFALCDDLAEITITDNVTAIGEKAFWACNALAAVNMNMTTAHLTTIGTNAFGICPALTSFSIPNSVTTMGATPFGYYQIFDNTSMKTVVIGSGLTEIPANTFLNFKALTSITLGSGLIKIGDYAFRSCNALTSITIPDSVKTIGIEAFGYCQALETVEIGVTTSTLETIDIMAFQGCNKLESINIPDSVTAINRYAFAYCTNLASVTLGSSVTAAKLTGIAQSTFIDCTSLTTITIPDKVTYIYNYAFGNCAALESVLFGTDSTLASISYYVFSDCTSLTGIEIPDTCLSIGEDAFFNCIGLESVTFGPDSALATISGFAFESCTSLASFNVPKTVTTINANPFYDCQALTSLMVDGASTTFKAESNILFALDAITADKTRLITYPLTGDAATYIVPDTVAMIGTKAFSLNEILTNVTIPVSVTAINGYAFYECPELTGVMLEVGSTLATIGISAFSQCDKLTGFSIPANVAGIGNYAFYGCDALANITVDVANTIFSDVDGVLFNKAGSELIQYPIGNGRISYSIPATVTVIDQYAFTYSRYLESVAVADANPNYSSADGVLFNKASTMLIYYPLANTQTSYEIPAGVTGLNDYVFFYCKYLTDIDVNAANTEYSSIGGVLTNKSENTLIQYPAAKTQTKYTIPGSILAIDYYAFISASNLKSITIPTSVNLISGNAFIECDNLTIYVTKGSVAESRLLNLGIPYSYTPAAPPAAPGDGGNGPATPPATTVTTGDTTTTTTTTAATDSGGVASATVTGAQMTDALDKALAGAQANGAGTAAVVEIKVEGATNSTSVSTTIPQAAFADLSGSSADGLKITTPIASITFDCAALDEISGKAAGDINITAALANTSSLTDAVKAAVGDRPVYNFTITSNGQTLSTFGGGSATVSLPYTLKTGEDPNAIVVYYIGASGTLQAMQGAYDAATGTVSFVTSHFSEYMIGYNKVTFTDVIDTAWYYDAVTFLAARGVTSGTTATNFSPDLTLTRGQFITMLLRAYGISADTKPTDNFADAGNTYYTGYLAAAKRLGISGGVGNNCFAPEQAIKRQEMSTLLYNALKALNQLPSGTSGKTLADFTDASDIASWAKDAMTLLVGTGTVSGSGGKLSPADTTTRAEMAQVLYSLLGK